MEYNYKLFYTNTRVAGGFLDALGSVVKRINVGPTVRQFFFELYEHYERKGLHPFEISAK